MPSPQQDITQIPSNRVEIIDSRTGMVSREWYRFFLNLFNLAGAGGNQTSLDDLQIGPPPLPTTTTGGGSGTVTSVDVSGGTTGLTTSGGPVTSSGTITLAGTLAVGSGGTGATTAVTARSNLSAAQSGANTDITSIALTSGTVTTAPSSSNDLVNKSYADSIATGINFHAACNYATTTALASNTYNNGSSGVGATLTAVAVGTLTIDGYTFVIGDVGKRILVKNEATGANNGIYTLTQAGTALLPYILTRATDYDTSGSGTNEIDQGDLVLILSGTTNANTSWVQQTPLPITVGTTALVFIQFAAVQTYTAGTGLSLTTNQFSITNIGTAGTYGSATQVPVLVTNAQGQVTSVTNTTATPAVGSITGLGTGVGTFLATPTSANLATAVTDETGSGALVFATSPTLVTPILGTPQSGNFSTGTFTWPTFNQNTTGSAATLTTGRTIAITGDLSYTSPSFDGSTNVTAAGTLATVNTNVGSFTNATLTVNGKGLITAASSGTAPVTSVTGTSPVVSSGGATPAISLASGYGDTQNPYASKTANYFLAAPNGSAGAPTFRAIVVADIPTLNQNTTGTAANITATSNSTLTTLSALSLPGSQVSGNISGNAANVTGTVAIANGGTGQTTQQAALTALSGTQTSGQYLRSNGTNTLLSAIQAADVPTLNQNTTGTASNVTGTVAIANGGTGQTTANTAFNALAPSQTSNSGKYLTTDGTNTSWATVASSSNTNAFAFAWFIR